MPKKDKYGPQIGRLPFASITYSVTRHCDTAKLTELLHPHNIPVCIQLYSNVIWKDLTLREWAQEFLQQALQPDRQTSSTKMKQGDNTAVSSMWNSHTASYYYYYYYHCLYSNNKTLVQGWSCALTV